MFDYSLKLLLASSYFPLKKAMNSNNKNRLSVLINTGILLCGIAFTLYAMFQQCKS